MPIDHQQPTTPRMSDSALGRQGTSVRAVLDLQLDFMYNLPTNEFRHVAPLIRFLQKYDCKRYCQRIPRPASPRPGCQSSTQHSRLCWGPSRTAFSSASQPSNGGLPKGGRQELPGRGGRRPLLQDFMPNGCLFQLFGHTVPLLATLRGRLHLRLAAAAQLTTSLANTSRRVRYFWRWQRSLTNNWTKTARTR